jgi:hypothetical protein
MFSQENERPPDEYLISYKLLRTTVGILGIVLSAVLILGDRIIFKEPRLRESISAYYHSGMGDVFVGTLCAIAVFMFAYRGPLWIDNLAGSLACFFAVGVALFPTTPLIDDPTQAQKVIGTIHVVMAAGLFATLAFFCLFLFTMSNKKVPGREKKIRNTIYYVCGGIMIVCMLAIALEGLVEGFASAEYRNQLVIAYNGPIFWPETVAIIAFAVSWLVKGEQLFGDKK